VAHFLEKRRRRAPEPRDRGERLATPDSNTAPWSEVQFVPARWLVLASSIVWALLSRRRISKVGIASLLWSVTPRGLKFAAGGLALFATVVFLGALAAIALLALQLT
jgi:hypothetical protein